MQHPLSSCTAVQAFAGAPSGGGLAVWRLLQAATARLPWTPGLTPLAADGIQGREEQPPGQCCFGGSKPAVLPPYAELHSSAAATSNQQCQAQLLAPLMWQRTGWPMQAPGTVGALGAAACWTLEHSHRWGHRQWLQPPHHRGFAVVKELRPVTLDDVVRRHRKGAHRGFWVIELYPNGAQLELPTPLSASDLGIPFRDAMLFSSENSVTDQKPTILVRQGAILFKSEAVRAVINANKAYIIKAKSSKSYSVLLESLSDAVKQEDAIPFELNVLEGLLYVSCRWFDTRMRHLKSIMEGLMRDVNDGTEPFAAVYNDALIQQLTPLDKAITQLRNSARDTCEAVRCLMEDEESLRGICLTQMKRDAKQAAELQLHLGDSGASWYDESRHAHGCSGPEAGTTYGINIDAGYLSDREQSRRMLESYDRELDAISGKLEEMGETLDTVRGSWGMKLDSARNHIILLNLKMSVASLCLMLATMLPSWGGMNIQHGLPDEPWVFWGVCVASCVVGVASYPLFTRVYRHAWRLRSRRDLLRFHALRAFLVEHLDDLDDVMDAVRKITGKLNRYQFELYMKEAMPSAHWKPASLDFLFSQYDLNKDGFLEGLEVQKRAAAECGLEEEHMPDFIRKGEHVDELYDEARSAQLAWGEWLLGISRPHDMPTPQQLPHDPGHMSHHEKRGWLARLLWGPQTGLEPLEERSGGRIVRH